jgi:predicted MFS family arabinose efflux permease
MEVLPRELRARATSLTNMAWNIGWAASATLAGVVIERFGFAAPFYITATLYLTAATTFFLAFRGTPESVEPVARLSEEAKGLRGEGSQPD